MEEKPHITLLIYISAQVERLLRTAVQLLQSLFIQMKLFVYPLICMVEFYLGRYQSVLTFIKHITTV